MASSSSSAGPLVSVEITSTTSYADLEAELCHQIDSGVSALTIYNPSASVEYFYIDLPECVFVNGTSIFFFNLQNVAIYGNASITDPLLRFPAASGTIKLKRVWLVNGSSLLEPTVSEQHPVAPNWGDFADRMTSLLTFECKYCGILTVPPTLPANLQNLNLGCNLINGTMPATVFQNFNTSTPSATLDMRIVFDYNSITGTLPPGLFTIPGQPLTLRTLVFSIISNNMSGPLPSKMFSPLTFTSYFQAILSNNFFSGSVPGDFLECTAAPSIFTFSVYLDGNRLSDELPSTLLTAANITTSTYMSANLNGNQFTGQIPDALLEFTTCGIGTMQLYFQDNAFTGTIPAFFNTVQCTSLTVLDIDFSNNSITGGVTPNILRCGSLTNLKTNIIFSHNKLTEPLDTTLFQGTPSTTQLALQLDYNQLSGNPFDAFAAMQAADNYPTVSITATNNKFSGSLPSGFLRSWSNPNNTRGGTSIFYVDLSYNMISGNIPADLFSGLQYAAGARVSLNLAVNSITGAFPSNLLSSVNTSQVVFVELNVSRNEITTLPSSLFSGEMNGLLNFNLYADSNAITTLPASFISTIPSSLVSMVLAFDNNNIGTIPAGFLLSNASDGLALTASFTNCNLNGRLETPLINPRQMGPTYLFLDNNKLVGSFNLSQLILPTSGTGRYFSISATNNNFDGTIAIENLTPADDTNADLNLSNNGFKKLSINATSAGSLLHLDISNNPKLTGTLPSFIFSNQLALLNASRTGLTGSMPNYGTGVSWLDTLDLSSTSIAFCTPTNRPDFAPTGLEVCSLANTNAASCRSKYPSQCFDAITCDNKTRPSTDFTCNSYGVWTATSSVTTPTLVIPGGASQTIVQGDVTSTSVIFESVSSTLIVAGCLNNLTNVTIVLTKSEIEKLASKTPYLLISYNGSDPSCSDLSAVKLHLKASEATCRRVTAETSAPSGSLSALFTINTSRCKTWWIILVSVVCGAILLFVIIFVLLILFVPSVRVFVRPYSKRR